ncbi:MAG: 2-C-methyl-D-erythritol 2,4-cyclodiphosphate synthase [Deltaproteobacteria bacterium]|nr:2-C-methyl-D-erythritol 2,4-cyclodiphosphate synthase [Deltaproteobacteria bacterium]
MRIGQGIDTHPFVEGGRLVLGGVEIPHSHGLQGHSDADALIHAICDGMLGALALGDIGNVFSDTDPANQGRDSVEFLQIIHTRIQAKGYVIGNIDTTIVTEKPKLAPYIPEMQNNLAKVLDINIDQISIKATRPEKMGALGRDEGLLALAIVLLHPK